MPKKKTAPTAEQLSQVDVAFVIDATGSMGPYIEAAKQHAQDIAKKVAAEGSLNIRYGVVIYRDHPPQDSVPSQAWDFSDNLGALQPIRAAGGGDREESVWDGVDAAIKLGWREGSDRRLFLIGDSPPHGHSKYPGDGFPQGCPCGLTAATLVERLKADHILVHGHSIAGYDDTTAAFRLLSDPTGGETTQVNTPHESMHTYTGTMSSTSGSIGAAREFAARSAAMPGASYVAVTDSLGWDTRLSASNASYMENRGIGTTTSDKSWEEINKNLKKNKKTKEKPKV